MSAKPCKATSTMRSAAERIGRLDLGPPAGCVLAVTWTKSLTQLKPEHIEDLMEHLGDLTVDVEDSDSKVHVFCE